MTQSPSPAAPASVWLTEHIDDERDAVDAIAHVYGCTQKLRKFSQTYPLREAYRAIKAEVAPGRAHVHNWCDRTMLGEQIAMLRRLGL